MAVVSYSSHVRVSSLAQGNSKQHFSIWQIVARFRLLKLVFVHMAEYTTYYAYTTARYLSMPNGVSPGFDTGTPSISPDMVVRQAPFQKIAIGMRLFA
jgi:hypothetical protein